MNLSKALESNKKRRDRYEKEIKRLERELASLNHKYARYIVEYNEKEKMLKEKLAAHEGDKDNKEKWDAYDQVRRNWQMWSPLALKIIQDVKAQKKPLESRIKERKDWVGRKFGRIERRV